MPSNGLGPKGREEEIEPTAAAFQFRTPAALRAGASGPGTVGAMRQSWDIEDMCSWQMKACIFANHERDGEGRLFVDLLDWRRTRTVASWSLAEAEHVLEVVDELPFGVEYVVRWGTVPRKRLAGEAVVVLAGTLAAAIAHHRHSLESCDAFDASDVFLAARWLDEVDNGVARAVASDTIEWRCRTWGSGNGHAAWEDVALFEVVASRFDLLRDNDANGRDQLLVYIPLRTFPTVAALIEGLGDEEPSEWPWFGEDDDERRVDVAAETLGVPLHLLQGNSRLLEALGLRGPSRGTGGSPRSTTSEARACAPASRCATSPPSSKR